MKPLMILLIATVISLLGEGNDKSEKQVEITKGINFVFPKNTLTTQTKIPCLCGVCHCK
jgi:hypothetical protein